MNHWDPDTAISGLSREIEALERVRQEVIAKHGDGRRVIMLSLLGVVVAGGLLAAVSGNGLLFLAAIPLGLIVSGVVYHIYFGKGKKRYETMFKVGLIGPMVKSVEPEMNYDPGNGISESLFVSSELFGNRPDRYHAEDLFHGRIGKTDIMFSEVHAEEKHTSTDSDGNTSTSWSTLFQGVFLIADFHKEFRSPVSVMPDFAERSFGWFGKKLQKMSSNLQRMENPEFEKFFVVRGVDPVETRYLLTPKMQESLVELRQRFGADVRIGFRDSKVVLAISNQENWFEGNVKIPANDHGQLKNLLFEIWSCFKIVEDLDLNTRIWSKD